MATPKTKHEPSRQASSAQAIAQRREAVLAELAAVGTAANRDGLARFGIQVSSGTVYGVPMNQVHRIAKELGRDHALAAALWETGAYEARLLCCFIDDPALLTSQQMDRWCRESDNWAIVDTLCFHLFLRSPLASSKIVAWSREPGEFQKRTAFALLASVALRVKEPPVDELRRGLALIEAASTDERNFVKKAVSWALRGIGTRDALAAEALTLAQRLATSTEPTARWIGKDAVKALTKAPKRAPKLEREQKPKREPKREQKPKSEPKREPKREPKPKPGPKQAAAAPAGGPPLVRAAKPARSPSRSAPKNPRS